jgi:hypothetical protein
VTVELSWRDGAGRLIKQTLRLSPGTHDLLLLSAAIKDVKDIREVPGQ